MCRLDVRPRNRFNQRPLRQIRFSWMCAGGTCMRGMHGRPLRPDFQFLEHVGRIRAVAPAWQRPCENSPRSKAAVVARPSAARCRAAGVMINFSSKHDQSVQGGVHRDRGPRRQNDQNPRQRTDQAGHDVGGPLRPTHPTHMRDAGLPAPISHDDGSSRTPCPRCQAREATLRTRTERSVSLRCRLCGEEWTLQDRRAGGGAGGRVPQSVQTEKPQGPPPGTAGGISDGES